MRRFLLDTHAFLWWLSNDSKLGLNARKAILDGRNEVYVSAATGWEISIKRALGKLDAPEDLDALVEQEGFTDLPITFFHGEQAGALPRIHADPFDRMLVAQAQAEGLTLISSDQHIKRYGVRILLADQ